MRCSDMSGPRPEYATAMPESARPMPLLVLYPLARPFLFGLDPEHAHDLTLAALAAVQRTPLECVVAAKRIDDPVTLAGLRFPNRIGLAAGLDKNGRCTMPSARWASAA